MRSVYSSVVDEIGYENGRLAVRWSRSNKVSVYEGVPPDVADQVMNAQSIGQALRQRIQPEYAHSYLPQEE